jgi:hypothetical protein
VLCNESADCANTRLSLPCNPAASNGDSDCKYQVEFADHSKMDGRLTRDMVILRDSRGGASTGAVLQLTHTIAELSDMSFIFKNGPQDGVLGLAPSAGSLHSVLHSQARGLVQVVLVGAGGAGGWRCWWCWQWWGGDYGGGGGGGGGGGVGGGGGGRACVGLVPRFASARRQPNSSPGAQLFSACEPASEPGRCSCT